MPEGTTEQSQSQPGWSSLSRAERDTLDWWKAKIISDAETAYRASDKKDRAVQERLEKTWTERHSAVETFIKAEPHLEGLRSLPEVWQARQTLSVYDMAARDDPEVKRLHQQPVSEIIDHTIFMQAENEAERLKSLAKGRSDATTAQRAKILEEIVEIYSNRLSSPQKQESDERDFVAAVEKILVPDKVTEGQVVGVAVENRGSPRGLGALSREEIYRLSQLTGVAALSSVQRRELDSLAERYRQYGEDIGVPLDIKPIGRFQEPKAQLQKLNAESVSIRGLDIVELGKMGDLVADRLSRRLTDEEKLTGLRQRYEEFGAAGKTDTGKHFSVPGPQRPERISQLGIATADDVNNVIGKSFGQGANGVSSELAYAAKLVMKENDPKKLRAILDGGDGQVAKENFDSEARDQWKILSALIEMKARRLE